MFLKPQDLSPFAEIPLDKAQAMIDDAEAKALVIEPKLAQNDQLSATQINAVRALLRDAILRWNDRGSGALTQTSIGQVNVSSDSRSWGQNLFTSREEAQLRSIAAGSANRDKAFMVNMARAGTDNSLDAVLRKRPDLKFQWSLSGGSGAS